LVVGRAFRFASLAAALVVAAAASADVIRAPEPDATASSVPAEIVSWETIADQMQSAHALLAAGDAGSTTQRRQREAVDHLDALIAAASASAGQNAPPNTPSGQDTSPSATGDTPSTDGRAANPNALESVERHGAAEAQAPDKVGPRRTSAEEFWGRLPEHVRNRVLQSAETKTIPKYRAAVEEYFQRLLESQPPPVRD
jgi:hypothetical protein